MKSSLILFKTIIPLPLNSIPINLLRLPTKSKTILSSKTSKNNNKSFSPTLEKLAQSISNPTILKKKSRFIENSVGGSNNGMSDGRGLGNALDRDGNLNLNLGESLEDKIEFTVEVELTKEGKLPSNLRIEEFIPKRIEYTGVKASHRDLVSFFYFLFEIVFSFSSPSRVNSSGLKK